MMKIHYRWHFPPTPPSSFNSRPAASSQALLRLPVEHPLDDRFTLGILVSAYDVGNEAPNPGSTRVGDRTVTAFGHIQASLESEAVFQAFH